MLAAPSSVYLLRHTRVADSSLCYGHHDVALADTFPADAAAVVAKMLGALGSQEHLISARLISSPAARCRQLAQALGPAREVALDERLREINFGTWENRPWASIAADELTPWRANYVTQAPPGGETLQQVQDRAAELTETARPTVLVSHGALIRTLLCHCLEMPLRHAFRLHIDFGSVTVLRWQGAHWQVQGVNG